jgi:hypothetical protein
MKRSTFRVAPGDERAPATAAIITPGVDLLRRTLLAMLAASRVALSAAADETVWRDYLEWYRAQPVNGPDTLKAYLDHLVKSGVGDPERNRRAGILERLIRERREELHTAFFDRTYAGAPRFNTAPNRLLAETVKGLRPGRALDVHMGQGRNAVFLAAQGWDVTGFDYSAEGVRAARKAARLASAVSRIRLTRDRVHGSRPTNDSSS